MIARAMTASDRRFVAPTWALSSTYDGLTKPERFKLVDRILDSGARCIVLAEDSTVHAWACASLGALHYAYVGPEIRRRGLGARAIALALDGYPLRISVTHEWPGASRRFVFTPHLLHREAA